jgi:hypothetical protein
MRPNGGTGARPCTAGALSVNVADREKDWLALFCRVGLRHGREFAPCLIIEPQCNVKYLLSVRLRLVS